MNFIVRIDIQNFRRSFLSLMCAFLALMCVVVSFGAGRVAFAEPAYTINYQGKLADNTGRAVPDGTYAISFALYTQPSGGAAIWTESRTGANEVTLTNGLFSVMLGEVASLAAVNFNQPLYLGITVESDGEMTPRKPLGSVSAAFEAKKLGGVASSSFLRSDAADIASGLLTFTGGFQSLASSTIASLTTLTATTTNLIINGERFTDLTGSGLALSGSTLTVTLGTDITAAEIANGDHGFFSYASGVASLETGGLTSAELLAALTNETGTGSVVFSASPTFTGTLNATAGTFSSALSLSGSAANIALGSNYLSGDGGDEGIFVDSSGNVGIGITGPQSNLDVRENTNNNGIHDVVRAARTGGSQIGAAIGYQGNGTDAVAGAVTSVGTSAPLLLAYTNGSAVPVEALRINTGGNVGIGTTSPYAKLSVNGSVVAGYYIATSTTATSTFPRLSATQVAFGGDYITDFTGTGLALSGSTLTATLGTDITAAEIANGDHGFFSYASGVASLDTGGLTSAELLAALTNETGTGSAVFSASPTFTGTLNAAAAILSSTLTLSGSSANIALGSNWLSGDGSDEGIFVNSSGNVGIGTTTPSELLHLYAATNSNLKVAGDASVNLILSRSSNNASNAAIDIQKARGTESNKIIVNSGDTVGGVNFMGYDGAAMRDVAKIRGAVDGSPSAGDMPGRLVFFTTPDASVTSQERMRIDSSGRVGIGTTSPNQLLTVQGNINLSSATGAIYFDDTKYIYASSTNDSVVFGENAGNFIGTGTFNIALGYGAARNATSSWNDSNIFIGYEAGYNNLYEDNIFIGEEAGWDSSGSRIVALGADAGWDVSGIEMNIIGTQAGYEASGSHNNLIGAYSGFSNTGDENNVMGRWAGSSNTGSYNNIFSYYAGENNTGSYNNIFGSNAGNSNSGDFNDIFGYNSAVYNSGDFNNIFGREAGYVNDGDYNQIIGDLGGRFLQSTSTVAVGAGALYGSHATNYISLNNVALGYRAGYASDDGSGNNILIGYQAADNLTTGNNNIIIGYDIDNITATADNRLNIGNLIFGTGLDGTGTVLASGNVGIGTSTPLQKLQVRGDIRVGTTGSNGCIEDYGGGVIGGTCSSDERLKENIEPIAAEGRSYLESLAALTPVTYNWNDTAVRLYGKNQNVANLGLVAQDVEALFPELVSRNEDGFRQVDFRALPFYIIEAMKELWARVQGHDQRLQSLEQELRDVVRENENLKVRISDIEGELDIDAPPPDAANQSEPTAPVNTEFIGPIQTDATPTQPEPTDTAADTFGEPAPAAANDNPAPIDDLPLVVSAGG